MRCPRCNAELFRITNPTFCNNCFIQLIIKDGKVIDIQKDIIDDIKDNADK